MFGARMKQEFIGAVVGVALVGAAAFGYWRYEQYLLGQLESAKERARLSTRYSEMKEILLACSMYAESHAGRFPGDLRQLTEVLGEDPPRFASALTNLELVATDARITNDPDTVLIRERMSDAKGRRVFGYIDGHSEVLDANGRPLHP